MFGVLIILVFMETLNVMAAALWIYERNLNFLHKLLQHTSSWQEISVLHQKNKLPTKNKVPNY
jgi:hypothetical protein